MGDYPDPDEEYELMYSTELEMLREMEDTDANPVKKKSLPAKRSLDFSSPIATKSVSHVTKNTENNQLSPSPSSINNNENDINLTPSLQALDNVLPESASNKRTAEDLFGDINDIDFETLELPSKRQKTDEEKDNELIERIIAARNMKQMLAEPSSKYNLNKKVKYSVKDNISFNIPSWAFFPVTQSSGDRMYVKFISEDSWDESLDAVTEKLSLQDTYTSAWEEARKILETKEQEVSQELTQQEVQDSNICVNTDLWVEKYRPQRYADLLSEEPVNRALLHWLHLWDKVVFKKEVKTKEPQQRNTFVKRTGQFQLSNNWKGKREEPELDEDGRPHHKVALLCGPPGVGKTTLAHLLARLAGYRPVELNASDERSTEAFQTALQSATQMRSVIDAERRPNCLILDEIDGAPLQTVELLVRWCTATAAGTDDKKKKKTQPLRRPVIAICNDLYATSLRPLRPVSLVVFAGAVSTARLSLRLSHVASAERLRLAARALSALAARVRGDVRSALHVLSFLKAKRKAQIEVEDVEKAAVGGKDHTRSMMEALQAVFSARSADVLRTVQAAGEYDRLADGIFENYLTARVDARLHIACETLAWLQLYDAVHSWTLRTQNYSLYGMLPQALARCHQLLATTQPQKLKFPLQAQEMSRKKAELDSIVWSVWRGSSPQVTTTRRPLRLDILPLLPHLLSPALRSANVQLCSEGERRLLRTAAGALCEYGLRYVQRRGADGLYAFALEPDVHRVAFIGNEERCRPPPAVRQALAREQQLEEIRRADEMMNKSNKNAETKRCAKTAAPAPAELPRLPNHLQRLNPKAVENVPQVHKDFFGRVVPITQSQKQNASTDVISSSGVFYQYREGFNNAVRRNVRLRDLL